jgi:hypothetical protein
MGRLWRLLTAEYSLASRYWHRGSYYSDRLLTHDIRLTDINNDNDFYVNDNYVIALTLPPELPVVRYEIWHYNAVVATVLPCF